MTVTTRSTNLAGDFSVSILSVTVPELLLGTALGTTGGLLEAIVRSSSLLSGGICWSAVRRHFCVFSAAARRALVLD
jgi:hypothetical protein